MSEDAEASAYVMDGETFTALKRVVGKLRGDGSLAGDERRNLASRMSALLQKAQPQRAYQGRQETSPDCSNDGLWGQTDQFGKM